jgi:hypothetical protein
MPSKSKKQHNFMEAIAHSEKFAKKVGVPMSVGKDFVEADKGRKFGTGGGVGITRGGQKQINKQTTRYGSVLGNEKNVPNINLNKYIGKKEGGMATESKKEMREEMKSDLSQDKKMIKKAFGMHDKQLHEKKKTDLSKLKGGGMAKMKETMGPRTMAMDVEKGSNVKRPFGESAVQKRGHTKGMEERDYKIEKIQGGAKGGKGVFGAAPIKMAKGGFTKSADGIAQKGKTRAQQFCMGGKAMKK